MAKDISDLLGKPENGKRTGCFISPTAGCDVICDKDGKEIGHYVDCRVCCNIINPGGIKIGEICGTENGNSIILDLNYEPTGHYTGGEFGEQIFYDKNNRGRKR